MAQFTSSVLDRFPVGTKLGVYPRIGDTFRPVDPVDTAVVPQSGTVKVSGLKPDANYWLAGQVQVDKDHFEWRKVSINATNDEWRRMDPISRRSVRETSAQTLRTRHAEAELAREGLPSAAPGRSVVPNVVTGARSSSDLKRRHQPGLIEAMENRQGLEAEPKPHVSQMDVSGVPQRSDTPFGEATPKDPDERVPLPSQDDVKANVKQSSDTPEGEAAPIIDEPESQGDAEGLKQSSDTEFGEATPKQVQGRKSKRKTVEAEERKESSVSKAAGTTAKPKRSPVKKR